MSDDKELSDEEYAALMRELQQGSGSGGGKAAAAAADDDGGVEDIDAFLSSLEDEADQKTTTAVAEREEEDPLAAEFAALLAKGELVATPDEPEPEPKEKGPTRAERRAARRREKEAEKAAREREKEAEKEAAREAKAARKEQKSKLKEKADGDAAEGSRGKRFAKALGINALWFTPAVIFLWVIGSYLGHWVSAGWLITAMSLLFVFGVPAILKKLVQRGEYRPWLLGFSLLLTVGLVAPIPNHAGQAMTQYGHWPASTLAEISGSSPNAGFVRANAGVAGWVGGLVATQEDTSWGARQLGTVFSLATERPTTPPVSGPADEEGPEGEPAVDEPVAEEPQADQGPE